MSVSMHVIVYLFWEHVPQELVEQVFGVEQVDEDSCEFVHVGCGHDAGQRHGDGQLPLVSDHRHQLHQALKTVGQRRLRQSLKLK